MKELHATENSAEGKFLLLGVETGGCFGFQYVFDLDNKLNPDDRVFERGVKLVVDNISYDFVKEATVDYVEELIRTAFLVMSNGLFKSTGHRVLTNKEILRISLALIDEPDPEKDIGSVEGLVDEKRPKMYRNAKNYGFINHEACQKGKVAIDIVQVQNEM